MRYVREERREQLRGQVTTGQFMTLLTVRDLPGTSLSQLAEQMGLSLSACSEMVDSLVQRDLLLRESDPKDRRRMALRLTSGGANVLTAHHEAARARLALCLERLSADELGVVSTAVQSLTAALQADEPN